MNAYTTTASSGNSSILMPPPKPYRRLDLEYCVSRGGCFGAAYPAISLSLVSHRLTDHFPLRIDAQNRAALLPYPLFSTTNNNQLSAMTRGFARSSHFCHFRLCLLKRCLISSIFLSSLRVSSSVTLPINRTSRPLILLVKTFTTLLLRKCTEHWSCRMAWTSPKSREC